MTYELKDIKVNEVSLVDRPAIRKKFMVIKNDGTHQEESMSDNENTQDPDVNADAGLTDADREKLGLLDRLADVFTGKSATPTTKSNNGVDVEALTKSITDSVTQAVSKQFESKLTASDERAEKAEQQVAQLQREAELTKAAGYVKANNWVGDINENAELYVTMKGALDEEAFDAWLQRENAQAAQLVKADLFTEVGSDVSNAESGDIVSTLAKSRREGQSYDDLAASIDPDEYMKHQSENNQRINRTLHGVS